MPKSIHDFLASKRRVGCKVCGLAPRIRKQINASRTNSRVRVASILEWLAVEHGIRITPDEWRRHYRGFHEGAGAQVHKKRLEKGRIK